LASSLREGQLFLGALVDDEDAAYWLAPLREHLAGHYTDKAALVAYLEARGVDPEHSEPRAEVGMAAE
jgi:hypothetical protein